MRALVNIRGLSIGGRTNTGDLSLAAYHPRWSITRVWFAHLTTRPGRGYCPTFSKAERKRIAGLYREGNPYASRPLWYHAFWQPASLRRGQWSDYLRLPFGRTLIIGHQKAMPRKGDAA